MIIDPKKYQNGDTRQLAIDLNTILGGGSSGIAMDSYIKYLPNATQPNPLVYTIPYGTISYTVYNSSTTEDLTIGTQIVKPQGSFSFSAGNGFMIAKTITITAIGSAEIAHTTPTP